MNIALAQARPTADRAPPRLPLPWLALALAAVVLGALALCLPLDHDEGQYVAAAALARQLRPYRDFAYLQTPLQLLLTAPIGALADGWAFIALRLANAAMALGELTLIYVAQRRLGAAPSRALAAAGLLLLAYPFEFSSVVARNDALPALLETGAMLAALEALRRRMAWPLWALAGLLLGAAVSAKLSYVFPPVAVGLYLLWRAWRGTGRFADVLACAMGGVLGLLPCLAAWLQSPEGFLWGAVTYAETAPKAWYGWLGQGPRLTLSARALEGGFHLAVGPALAMLAGVLIAATRRRREPVPSGVALLQVLALGGVAAAFAPSPMQRQYLEPLLPPLVVLWGVRDPALSGAGRLALGALLAIGIATGVGRVGYVLGEAALGWIGGRPPPALALTAEAHWLDRTLAATPVRGPVATLSPLVVVDSGLPLDPRFASGVFAYRTGDLVPDDLQSRLHILSPRTLARGLDAQPPAAIITGFETPVGVHRRNPDDDLRAYARARGYAQLISPDGVVQVWLRSR